ncbi:hypothetical protein NLG97_g2323 [Lecanicillium saksenae]|uniref:Uncharacterized protein n=1 Tax=Lecanicillium saksenae TaxID=468837 RepID=A0ACC1R2H5_9HYPO|nr:hypothetical protein NLG97_g2323 [Lecanicillium saksenae]
MSYYTPSMTVMGNQYDREHAHYQIRDTYQQLPQQQLARKQTKWSPEEDAIIIQLRGNGMKWDDISKHLPGRSSISCRLHYQNYLERRSEWDEDRKDKLARLYDRFKAEMWAKVAEELQVPWRAAEAMHWQLGESDMVRRAGGTLFTLAADNYQAASRKHQIRTQNQRQIQGQETSTDSMNAEMTNSHPSRVMSRHRTTLPSVPPQTHSLSAGVTSVNQHHQQPPLYGAYNPKSGPGLPPIQHQPQPPVTVPLTGVAELTTGMTQHSTPRQAHRSWPPPLRPHNIRPDMAEQNGHQPAPMCLEPQRNRLKRPSSPERRF